MRNHFCTTSLIVLLMILSGRSAADEYVDLRLEFHTQSSLVTPNPECKLFNQDRQAGERNQEIELNRGECRIRIPIKTYRYCALATFFMETEPGPPEVVAEVGCSVRPTDELEVWAFDAVVGLDHKVRMLTCDFRCDAKPRLMRLEKIDLSWDRDEKVKTE